MVKKPVKEITKKDVREFLQEKSYRGNAGIDNYKEINSHTLRHSFATHLIQNNYPITRAQASLEHKNSETSLVYIHTSGKHFGKRSPFNSLE